jgi:hypothetical protein
VTKELKMRNMEKSVLSVDDWASGELPERLISAINQMELTVAEMTRWETSKPAFRVVFTEGNLVVEIRTHVPIKKALAVLGSVVGTLWIVAKLIAQYWGYLEALAKMLTHTQAP